MHEQHVLRWATQDMLSILYRQTRRCNGARAARQKTETAHLATALAMYLN